MLRRVGLYPARACLEISFSASRQNGVRMEFAHASLRNCPEKFSLGLNLTLHAPPGRQRRLRAQEDTVNSEELMTFDGVRGRSFLQEYVEVSLCIDEPLS